MYTQIILQYLLSTRGSVFFIYLQSFRLYFYMIKAQTLIRERLKLRTNINKYYVYYVMENTHQVQIKQIITEICKSIFSYLIHFHMQKRFYFIFCTFLIVAKPNQIAINKIKTKNMYQHRSERFTLIFRYFKFSKLLRDYTF